MGLVPIEGGIIMLTLALYAIDSIGEYSLRGCQVDDYRIDHLQIV